MKLLSFSLCVALFAVGNSSSRAAPYVAVDPARDAQPPIVLSFDSTTGAGLNWAELSSPRTLAHLPRGHFRDAVHFLQDGIRRMTGRTLDVQSGTDLRRGIILTLLENASPDISDDRVVQAALRNDGTDAYNDREAFYLRSEADRLLVVANTIDGLIAAMPALLETVDYEVLAMGPNWIHVPTDRQRLVFDVEKADRPSFYLRQLTPTSGQYYGVGTIMTGPKLQLTDPADESVSVSWPRWAIALRNHGRSMAPFPGHSMYQYHRRLVEHIIATGSTEGFLTAGTHLGPDADRPAAAESNAQHLWINSDAKDAPGYQRVFLSDGKAWNEQKLVGMAVNLDPTTPIARKLVLDEMTKRAAAHFAESPDEPFVFGTEAEDGAGYANIDKWTAPQYRNWYTDYLKSQGVAWPKPYVLHGYNGIDQPLENYDPTVPADVVFALNNWLLMEFDRWVDALPEAERVTASGKSKKELARCSLYSYALHDIPPAHNLDPRIRVMIASYPKHRGLGKWKRFATQLDMAKAFKVMLPREPSGDYRIISISYYADHSLEGIPARWSAAPERIVADLRKTYDGGIRALAYETDFNFGKYGLAYYLMSRVLWNVDLTPAELDAVRDRWLRRAYGSGAPAMKQYYDFMLLDNYPANAPAAWAKAVRFIEAADAAIDPKAEPDAQRRLDDLKQYWYFYFLLDTDRAKPDAPEMIEFAWKAQMSYANAMHMVLNRVWTKRSVADVVPETLRAGPAHYSPDETAAWWRKVLEHWPAIEVANFADAKLADGRRGADVDLNDLVRVTNFQSLTDGRPFLFNSAQEDPTSFVTTARAGDTIGFRFTWPANDEVLRFYGPKDVPYGIEHWDPASKQWSSLIDVTLTSTASHRLEQTHDGKPRHVAEVQFPATQAGTYRIEVGRGGFLAQLGSLGYDATTNQFATRPPHTYFSRLQGLTQDPVYVYIPKGTKSLDLETWDAYKRKLVQFHKGVSERGLVKSREVDVSTRGTHRIPLEPGEDGNLVKVSGNGFAFPVLYSVPSYWAKCPAELVIPRAIAEADGLTIEK